MRVVYKRRATLKSGDARRVDWIPLSQAQIGKRIELDGERWVIVELHEGHAFREEVE